MSDDQEAPPALHIPDHEVLQYTRAEWDRRAAVARASADEIREAVRSLDHVARENIYGGCAEGRMFYERLQAFVQGLRDTWNAQADQISDLGTQCAVAGQRLDEQDAVNVRDLTI